jgi:hypothetical protein
MKIAWFSCGVTSAVACKIALEQYGKDNVELYYMVIDSAHPDNERFIQDCERWLDKKVNRVRSEKYVDQFDVIEKTKYINGPSGARCTLELKKKPPILPDCGTFCEIEFADLIDPNTERIYNSEMNIKQLKLF